jgi:hypothetical protein
MPIISLTPLLSDIRTVRAGLYLPQAIAITLLVLLPLLISQGPSHYGIALWFSGISLSMWLLAYAARRGAVWAAVILTIVVSAVPVAGFIASFEERNDPEWWAGFFGALVFTVPAWLGLRAVRASRRLRRIGLSAHTPSSMRGWISEVPLDGRLVHAVIPVALSVFVYACGALFAIASATVVPVPVAALLFYPFAWLGSRLVHRARRRVAKRVQEIRTRDHRAPLLLLRSFADDDLPLERQFNYFARLLQPRFTLEEFVVNRLWALGPVIAIGQPREALSPVGAAREYVYGPDWQERVIQVMDECVWVVSVLGESAGLIWEYQQILSRGLARRFILVFPTHAPDIIRQRWENFRRVFPPAAGVDLPNKPETGTPLVALFRNGDSPVLFCCKFRDETAHGAAFDKLLQDLLRTRER